MPTERSSAASDRRHALGWATIGCETAVVLAWLLLVLRYQYGVAWLQPYEVSLDGLFLAAVAGVLLARVIERRTTADAASGAPLEPRLDESPESPEAAPCSSGCPALPLR